MPYKKIDPHEEETIRKMPISELKQVCEQPMSGDFKEADLAIMRCRILASRLRHEHCYEEAKIYYRKAIIDIKKILGSLVEAEENLSELDHQIFLLETSMDLGLTLFEQELYDECLDQLQKVQSDIEQISEDHKNNQEYPHTVIAQSITFKA
jgi:tetratricopeptide (TPR) repeat protein